MGWYEVLSALENAPFCEEHGRMVNVLFCRKFGTCSRNGLCAVAKMESITFRAIRCLTKTTTTKPFRNTGERRLVNYVKETQAVNISNKKEKQSAMLGCCLHICHIVAELSSPPPLTDVRRII